MNRCTVVLAVATMTVASLLVLNWYLYQAPKLGALVPIAAIAEHAPANSTAVRYVPMTFTGVGILLHFNPSHTPPTWLVLHCVVGGVAIHALFLLAAALVTSVVVVVGNKRSDSAATCGDVVEHSSVPSIANLYQVVILTFIVLMAFNFERFGQMPLWVARIVNGVPVYVLATCWMVLRLQRTQTVADVARTQRTHVLFLVVVAFFHFQWPPQSNAEHAILATVLAVWLTLILTSTVAIRQPPVAQLWPVLLSMVFIGLPSMAEAAIYLIHPALIAAWPLAHIRDWLLHFVVVLVCAVDVRPVSSWIVKHKTRLLLGALVLSSVRAVTAEHVM